MRHAFTFRSASASRVDESRVDESRVDESRVDESRVDESRVDESRIAIGVRAASDPSWLVASRLDVSKDAATAFEP